MPIYDADSEFAAKRDLVKLHKEQADRIELRKAVARQPERFVTPEEFLRQAAKLGLDDE